MSLWCTFSTLLHVYGLHIAFSKYINPSTEQQRVNLTYKIAEADTPMSSFPAYW